MTSEEFEELQELIKEGHLKKALDKLSLYLEESESLRSAYLQISRRLTDIENQYQKGVINFSDYQLHRSQITEAIINFTRQINDRNEGKIFSNKSDNIFTCVAILIYTLFFVSIVGFIVWQGPLILNALDEWIEQERLFREEEERRKKEMEVYQQRLDSMNRETRKFIDSLSAIRYDYPELTIEEKRFTGVDNNGFKAEYIIYLIRGFNWRLGEITVGEEDGVEFEICNYLSSSGINSRLNSDSLKAIVCFGNTSYEEDLTIPSGLRLKKEEDRAEKRANKLAKCVNDRMKKLTPVYTLNLGKHGEETELSEWQRQIIIIGLVKKDTEIVEEEALFNGLVREYLEGNLEFNVMDYSKVGYSANLLRMKRVYN